MEQLLLQLLCRFSYATALYTQAYIRSVCVNVRISGPAWLQPVISRANMTHHFLSFWAHLSASLTYLMMSDVSRKCCSNIGLLGWDLLKPPEPLTHYSEHWDISVYIVTPCECACLHPARVFVVTPSPSSSTSSCSIGLFMCFPASSGLRKQSERHRRTLTVIRHDFAQCPIDVNTLQAYVILIFHTLVTSRPAIQT